MHLVVAKAIGFLIPGEGALSAGIIHILDLEDLALLFVKREEAIFQNALPDIAHQLVIEVDVMLPHQLPPQWLLRFRQVMEISARVRGADGTRAARIDLFLRKLIR